MIGWAAGGVLPQMTATDVALLFSTVVTAGIGVLSLVITRKGAAESRAQQIAADELGRRSQGFDEMQRIAEARASDLAAARVEAAHMQERIDRLREENRLLRELTRAQVGLTAAAGLLPPMEGEPPDRPHLEDRPPLDRGE